MLGKRSRPVIGKLTDTLVPGDRSLNPDVITSPKSPLDFKIRSPRGLKNNDLGGVGLGIVAALEKAGGGGGRSEIQAKLVVGSLNLNRSSPIPVGPAKNTTKVREGIEKETWEYIHGSNKSNFGSGHDRRTGFSDQRCNNKNLGGVFCESPPRFTQAVPAAFPTLDFLSSCHLCRKKLHGKDIYMYRGEKAFCSSECRYRQIVMDERKEMCGSEASRTAEMAGSPYSGGGGGGGQLFSTGIIAT